jgi:hypothetical protein
MPTVLASSITSRAGLLLEDDTYVRWTEAELLGWLNDGQREIVSLRPSANPKTVVAPLVAGTRQTVPAEAYQLVRITRNMGVGGATPGRAVRLTDMAVLDQQNPDWHSDTASAVVRQYMYDLREPLAYYVYPAAVVNATVEMTYSYAPPVVAAVGNTITLPDIYANALLDYVLFRAYAKDGEHPANASRAAAYRQSFENSLGLKAQADASSQPTTQGG